MAFRTSIKDIMLKKFFNGILALFATGSVSAQAEPVKVLFIGNSYTHMNNMPKMFEKISKDAGMNVIVEKCAQSGASFKVHSEREEVYEAIKSRDWDYVILQGYSRELTFDPEHIDTATVPYLNKITTSIYDNYACTNVLFYMTWGYEDGYHEREETNSYLKMAHKIEEGYRYLSDVYNVPAVPVGMVWKEVKATNSMDLYAKDRAHPSKEGSYLVASTFFESIFGFQQNENIGLIKERRARTIREAVSDVVTEKRELYKLSRHQLDLEILSDETGDKKDRFSVKYTLDHANAKSIQWIFDEEETREGTEGIFEFEKRGKHKIQANVVTECGNTRTYEREIDFKAINCRRNRRKQED